ncbi:hypothetical protein HDU90_001099 [Geranomyces variabilis]|nr:hypothetical protein HDU90_001099 [Geranomyces variabilis]
MLTLNISVVPPLLASRARPAATATTPATIDAPTVSTPPAPTAAITIVLSSPSSSSEYDGERRWQELRAAPVSASSSSDEDEEAKQAAKAKKKKKQKKQLLRFAQDEEESSEEDRQSISASLSTALVPAVPAPAPGPLILPNNLNVDNLKPDTLALVRVLQAGFDFLGNRLHVGLGNVTTELKNLTSAVKSATEIDFEGFKALWFFTFLEFATRSTELDASFTPVSELAGALDVWIQCEEDEDVQTFP